MWWLLIWKELIPQKAWHVVWVTYVLTARHRIAQWRPRISYSSILIKLALPSLCFWEHLHENMDSASCWFIMTWSHRIVVAMATPAILLTWCYKFSGKQWETDTYESKRHLQKNDFKHVTPPQLQTLIDYKSSSRRQEWGKIFLLNISYVPDTTLGDCLAFNIVLEIV